LFKGAAFTGNNPLPGGALGTRAALREHWLEKPEAPAVGRIPGSDDALARAGMRRKECLMRHGFGTSVLIVAALFCLLTTWSSATAPGSFAQRLGLVIANAAGSNEIRAQYAGFFFAVAAVCAISLTGAVSRQSAYLVLAVVFGGLISGRLVSLVVDGGIAGYTPTILALYAIDSLGFVFAVTAIAVDG
jgi:hypothetical protein